MTRFQPGQSGNPTGRPKGARNRISEQFIEALSADFETNGAEVVAKVRETMPHVYLKVIASILPKDVQVTTQNPFDDMTDDELEASVAWLGARVKGEAH